ncbi:hypothetical protein ABKN59_009757 [Abortiporus biennis]
MLSHYSGQLYALLFIVSTFKLDAKAVFTDEIGSAIEVQHNDLANHVHNPSSIILVTTVQDKMVEEQINLDTALKPVQVSGHHRWLQNLKSIRGSFDSLLRLNNESPQALAEDLSPSSESQQLPLELIAHILHFLRYNTGALAKCCLVSSSWLDLSRQYLFHQTVLTVDGKAHNFLPALESLEALERVWKHIKVLLLRCSENHSYESYKRPALCIHLLMSILEKLPNLKNLHIEDARFIHTAPTSTGEHLELLLKRSSRRDVAARGSTDPCVFGISSGNISQDCPKRTFPIPLEYLTIDGVGADGDPAFPFREILTLFSSYTKFDTFVTRYTRSSVAEEASQGIKLTDGQDLLWNFVLRYESANLTFSSTPPSYQTMAHLGVGCDSFDQFLDVAQALREVTPNLEHFSIDPTKPVDWSQLNLARFESLRDLSISIDFAVFVAYQSNSLLDGSARLLCRYPADLLSTLPRSIERITIGIRLQVDDVENFIMFVDWDVLQKEFMKFPKLTKVQFDRMHWGGESKSAYLKEIGLEEKLPMLQEVLKINDQPISEENDFFLSISSPLV